jgi:hypothetical protein
VPCVWSRRGSALRQGRKGVQASKRGRPDFTDPLREICLKDGRCAAQARQSCEKETAKRGNARTSPYASIARPASRFLAQAEDSDSEDSDASGCDSSEESEDDGADARGSARSHAARCAVAYACWLKTPEAESNPKVKFVLTKETAFVAKGVPAAVPSSFVYRCGRPRCSHRLPRRH